MESEEISEKELERRRKISEARKQYLEEKRRAGYERYLIKLRKQIERRKEREKEEKERRKAEKAQKRALEKKKPKKRKVGRPKKRGPKKKRKYISRKVKIDGRTCSKYKRTLDFKIVSCYNNKQDKYFGVFRTYDEAYAEFNRLIKLNDDVIFSKDIHNDGKVKSTVYEYLLLEKNRFGDKTDAKLRNEYGKFVAISTNSDRWVVLDKAFMLVEETFWVFGYDNKKDRKTFRWIYDNIITHGLESKYDTKRIILYKNKIVVKDDDLDLDIVFCKTSSDAIRFYNLLEKYIAADKIKNVIFLGQYNDISDKRRELEEKLIEVTGYDKRKIQMDTTKKCSQGRQKNNP